MDKENIKKVALEIVDLLEQKTKHYGDSWKSRGGSGAFHNIARKWDRLENQCKKQKYDVFDAISKDKEGEEGVRDSLIDLVSYGLLILEEMEYKKPSPKAIFETALRESSKLKAGENTHPYGYDENLDK
jgi:hypothetical protein